MKRKKNLYDSIYNFENILNVFNEVCRNTKSKRKVGAKAASKLPRIKRPIIETIKVFRFQVPVRIVNKGAPTVTPKA